MIAGRRYIRRFRYISVAVIFTSAPIPSLCIDVFLFFFFFRLVFLVCTERGKERKAERKNKTKQEKANVDHFLFYPP